jgi:hypothetical protein
MRWLLLAFCRERKGDSMTTVAIEETPEISDAGLACLTPQIEDWRRKLERTCRHLLPWACSAQMLPMWVSDYGKVCRLAAALSEKLDDLFCLTEKDYPAESAENASVLAAIDQTIDEIDLIGQRIERELHDSVGNEDGKPRHRIHFAAARHGSLW